MSTILSDYLTREQLATEFGVTLRTIARWQKLPDGLPKTTIGNRTLYRIASVRAWLEANERQSNPRRRRAA